MKRDAIRTLRVELEAAKTEAAAARADAKRLEDESAADPTNTTKRDTADAAEAKAVEAEAKLEALRNALADAAFVSTDTSEEIQEYKARVILLTIYLLAAVLLSIYLLAGFFMAETDPAEINKRRDEDRCCRANANSNSSANANASTNANTNSNVNTNRTISNTSASDAPTNSDANRDNVTPGSGGAPGGTGGRTDANSADDADAGQATSGNVSNSSGTNSDDRGEVSPTPTPDPAAPEISIPKYVYVRFPGFPTGDIWSAESYIFLIVFFAGMLGGTIRALHSLVKHLGLKNFSFYWSWFYITLPLSGSGLAIVIYFVLRGGFYGGGFGKGLVINVFSFAALAALTGLFTDNAMEKLKQVAVTLLSDVPPKVDNAKEIEDKKESEKKYP